AEMDYWNFFAQRLANVSQQTVASVDGYVPFRTATNDLVSLTTSIKPSRAPALPQLLETAAPSFGVADFRDVELTSPMASRMTAGRQLDLKGHVTATAAAGVSQIEMVFWKDGSAPISF